jgi:hypothetical protein
MSDLQKRLKVTIDVVMKLEEKMQSITSKLCSGAGFTLSIHGVYTFNLWVKFTVASYGSIVATYGSSSQFQSQYPGQVEGQPA